MRHASRAGIATLSTALLAACASIMPGTPSATASQAATSAKLSPSPPAQISSATSWIEADVTTQTVALHDKGHVVEYPVSTGVTGDPRYATPPGLYGVQSKEKGPIESVPGVYVTDVVMFDLGKGNGFHSRPMDEQGNLLDATLGKPSTAGCVRVGESAKLFDFAEVGMLIWIH